MTYFEFLRQPYNLPFAGAVILGCGAWFLTRRRSAVGLRFPAALFVATGVSGLTINGAIHDMGLDGFGRRFPWVLLASIVLGAAVHGLVRRVGGPRKGREVRFNDPDLEGETAIVLSRPTREGGAGRARVRRPDGVTHIVRIESDTASKLRFAARVRLGPFDEKRAAYPVERL